MIGRKKYDVFGKQELHLTYPELSFVISGIFIENSIIKIDDLFRFVVYFYNRDCNELQEHTDVLKAREAALKKFSISKSIYQTKDFENAENEMALRFMMYGSDNLFNVFISLSFQLSNMLASIRKNNKDDTWSDRLNSLKSSSEVVEISERLDVMRQKILGDMKHIEQFAMKKELDNQFKAETAML
jgi:hypothetical protein